MRKLFVFLWAILFSGMASTASAAAIHQGLAAYWQMEGIDGPNILDATPFSNNMAAVAITGANFVPGQFGNALSLNGSSQFATNLHAPDPSLTGLPIYKAGSYTITMWVKGPAQTARFLYTEAFTNAPGNPPVTTPNNPLFILQTGQQAANNAKFDVIIRDDAGGTRVNHTQSTNIVFDNNWHHIAWVDNLGSVRLYIDGNLDPANFSYTPSGNFTLNTSTLGALTRGNVAGFFNGVIDDVALWRRALTADEVQAVRTNSIPTPVPAFSPEITLQPLGSTNREGDRVTLTAGVNGSPPLSFQWLKNGTEIPGATSLALSFSNLVTTNSGDYVLRATNRFGTNFSSVATLLVIPDPAPDLRGGIVSYWSMNDEPDDGTGNVGLILDDYGSNTFRAVALGGFIDLAPGIFANAAKFNGSDQYLLRSGGFPIYNNPAYSVAFWINGSASQSDRRFFAESATNNDTSTFSFGTQTNNTGTLRALVRNEFGQTVLDRSSTRVVLDDTWHHVVWTETNGAVRLFIDGLLDDTSFNYARPAVPLNTTTLGALLRASGASNFFNGLLDEVSVWSRPLSFTEVQMLRTNTVPPPLGGLALSITGDPANQSVPTRTRATFGFAASGTGPFSWNWRKNGTNLPNETNVLLVLNNVGPGDVASYDVVVSTVLGRATSHVATLTLTPDFKIDFNNVGGDDIPANTGTNFLPFVLDATPATGTVVRTFGALAVSVSPVGGINMQSRRRALPVNAGDFTEERLLQDFIFAPDTALGQGLDVAVDFLESNRNYALTIWSFDNVNNSRFSDWSANGTTLTNGYTFTGSVNPTNNAISQFTRVVSSDANGRILIQARRNASATNANNVFINALQLTLQPPSTNAIHVDRIERTATNTLHLVISGITPASTRTVQQITNVTDSNWSDVPGTVFGVPNGATVEALIPVPPGATRFYRVVETP